LQISASELRKVSFVSRPLAVQYQAMSETNPKIIALVGMPGSGKGTCTDYLSEAHSWPVIHFGNAMYDELLKQGYDSVKDENWFRKKLRDDHGPAVLAMLVSNQADERAAQGEKVIVLDGLYSWTEYKYMHGHYGDNLTVIAVAAPRKLRYERILTRQDSHRKYSGVEQIVEREIAEIENIEKGGPIAYADFTIVNDGAPEDMTNKLDGILKSEGIL
jgi:dephospho-CoA kinase